jgi:hypothetical protein
MVDPWIQTTSRAKRVPVLTFSNALVLPSLTEHSGTDTGSGFKEEEGSRDERRGRYSTFKKAGRLGVD